MGRLHTLGRQGKRIGAGGRGRTQAEAGGGGGGQGCTCMTMRGGNEPAHKRGRVKMQGAGEAGGRGFAQEQTTQEGFLQRYTAALAIHTLIHATKLLLSICMSC